MSKKKSNKMRNWGGARKRSGHPKTGITKVKKCVSVNQAVWQSALRLWHGNASPLVEKLLSAYVKEAGNNKPVEAV